MKRVVVTGAAGQIAYSLLFRLAKGELFGHDEPFALHLLELPEALSALEGVRMELEDSAFPLLKEIKIGSDPRKMFEEVTHAFLIGAKPRGPGMERAELLKENGKIFIEQGKALNETANRNVKILVVGNPCNTNCLIALRNAPNLPQENFHAMTMLDQNRAVFQLANKAKVSLKDVNNLAIWGNHSLTMVPDFFHATIKNRPVTDVIKDIHWLENDFISTIQKRGANVIAARGKSSAGSAATAALDEMRSILYETPEGQFYSCAIYSKNNPYQIDRDLIFSFPCRTNSKGKIEIITGLDLNDFVKEKLKISENELKEERGFI